MKIHGLKVQNIKRIKIVEIKTEGENFIEISGKNAQGKSSLLDSIAYGLGGTRLIPERPIRDGETHAEIEIDIGEFIVKRTFTPSGSTLKIHNKEGLSRNSPQAFLDATIGTLSFDPLAFCQLEPKKRAEMFKKLAGIDTDKLDADYKELYVKRTDASKLVAQYKTELEFLEPYALDVDVPDISELQKQRDKLTEHSRYIYDLGYEKNSLNKDIEAVSQSIKHLEEKLAIHNARLFEINCILEVDSQVEKIDASQIDEKIKNIQPLLMHKNKHQDYIRVKAFFNGANAGLESLQKDIDNNIAERKKLLESAKLPVDGLGLFNDQVYYNKIPFEQLSQAEQLKVSMAMAVAENPKLKIVRIMDGSLLDSDSKKVIEELANKYDYQVFMETVSDKKSDGNAVYIEDGEIAA